MESRRRLLPNILFFVASLFFLIAVAAWFVLSVFSENVQQNLKRVYRTQAQSVGEQIGAQFFERYSDVQAISSSLAILMRESHSVTEAQDLINSYVRLYRLYDLIMVVDTNGKPLFINNSSIRGEAIDVSILAKQNYANRDWFQKPMSGVFTEDDSRGLRGAYFGIEDQSREIMELTQDKMPHAFFSTILRVNGKVHGVVVTHARLDWVTQEVSQQYNKLVKIGMPNTLVRTVDGKGNVIASSGPNMEDGTVISAPLESAKFPSVLDWRVEIKSNNSDIRGFIEYWRIYYILLGMFFILATALVVGYFGRQFKSLATEYEEAKAVQGQLENKVKERTSDLEKNIKELKVMQDRMVAQEKMVGLGVMASGLAHEIRNPLNIVLNSAQVLKEHYSIGEADDLNEHDMQNFADLIIKHSERIESLIKAILLSARKGHGDLHLVNVYQMGAECLKMSVQNFELSSHLKIPFKLEKTGAPPIVRVDEDDLRRIFLNLIDNALYSLSKKWGEKQSEKALLRISTETADKDGSQIVRIRVWDNGLGLSEENKKNLFVPFFTTKDPGKGTGLGLVISSDIVRKYGGTIEVESEPGEYCCFIVELPSFGLGLDTGTIKNDYLGDL